MAHGIPMPPQHPAGPPAGPPVPGPPRRTSTGVWVAAGVSAFAAVAAVLVLVAVAVSSARPAAPRRSDNGPDLAQHYDAALDSKPQAVEVQVDEHPFYDLKMPEQISCDLPDLDPESASSWENFSDELGGCLNELWRPRLEELGVRTEPPTFHVTEKNPDEGSSQEGMTLAYYENDKRTITVVLPNVTALSEDVPDRYQESVWSALIGHEYGHHIQDVTGILTESYEMEDGASSESEALETLRRTELQAECMGGIAMRGYGVFNEAEVDKVNRFLNGGSDLPTHGSSKNRKHWFDEGNTGSTLADCNTFDAPASRVR